MKFEKLSYKELGDVSGGSNEGFYNTCKKCGKVWDMRDYGYGKDKSIPEWVTGPWCPECRRKLTEKNKNSVDNV